MLIYEIFAQNWIIRAFKRSGMLALILVVVRKKTRMERMKTKKWTPTAKKRLSAKP